MKPKWLTGRLNFDRWIDMFEILRLLHDKPIRFHRAGMNKEIEKLKQRIKTLETALNELLEVTWPNPDLPDARTNVAIRKARRVLRRAA